MEVYMEQKVTNTCNQTKKRGETAETYGSNLCHQLYVLGNNKNN